jgi:hypothetical protein
MALFSTREAGIFVSKEATVSCPVARLSAMIAISSVTLSSCVFNSQLNAFELGAIELFYSPVSITLVFHFNKRVVGHQTRARNFSIFSKELLDIRLFEIGNPSNVDP